MHALDALMARMADADAMEQEDSALLNALRGLARHPDLPPHLVVAAQDIHDELQNLCRRRLRALRMAE